MVAKPPTFRRPALGTAFVDPRVVERPSAAKRGYGREWRTIRAAFLARHPTCPCGAPATEVDHRRSLRKGGTNAGGNLQALCKACHARKTNAVDGGGFRAAPGDSKNPYSPEGVDPRSSLTRVSTKSMSDHGVRGKGGGDGAQ